MSIQTLETPPLAATKIVRPSLLKRIRHSDMWWSFTHNKTAMASAALLAILILTAIFAPLIAPQNPYDGAQLDMWQAELPPIWEDRGEWPFLLGTDTQGRDMLSAILYGTRISIVIGIASVALSLLIGMSAGLVSGFFGGFIDNFLMRIGDITLSIPTILSPFLSRPSSARCYRRAFAKREPLPYSSLRLRSRPGFNMPALCARRRLLSLGKIMCRPQGLSVFHRIASWQSTSCPTR